MDYNILSGSPLFRGLSSEDIKASLSGIPEKIRRFSANSLIFQTGDQVNSMAFVISGYVKGEMVDYAGRVIKIEDIKVPGAIAPAFMFGARNRFPVNVVAVVDAELLVIDKPDFLKLLKSNEQILVNFLDMISNRSQFLSDKIKFLNFKTIKSKLAQYILDLAGKDNNEIKLDRTQNDLADYFGVARPSVARALGDLEEMGCIKNHGKTIRILDRDDLTDLVID
ncbi:MAG TPA: Crp/Fnr family transcriptional regulator [Bacteroidales bacterium]|nr:Crp/Fnr family transcriptional regulator [Bacteroidales bacterium]